MSQLNLFEPDAPPQYDGIPLPEQVVDEPLYVEDVATFHRAMSGERVVNQRQKILALLRQGNVTNFELADICIRYSARIHELRKEGHEIETVARLPGEDKNSALVVYRLKEQG